MVMSHQQGDVKADQDPGHMSEVDLNQIKGDIRIQGIVDHHENERGEPIMVMPEVTIPRPTVASIFQSGAEDLSSSCPTSQEPVQTKGKLLRGRKSC